MISTGVREMIRYLVHYNLVSLYKHDIYRSGVREMIRYLTQHSMVSLYEHDNYRC